MTFFFCTSVIKEEITEFRVNNHPGHPVTYEWDFDDGTSRVTELTGAVNHSFSDSGRYNVTVKAYNELGEDVAWVSGALLMPENQTLEKPLT